MRTGEKRSNQNTTKIPIPNNKHIINQKQNLKINCLKVDRSYPKEVLISFDFEYLPKVVSSTCTCHKDAETERNSFVIRLDFSLDAQKQGRIKMQKKIKHQIKQNQKMN
jgi:hypothetical protein